jgi:hypothetical protein
LSSEKASFRSACNPFSKAKLRFYLIVINRAVMILFCNLHPLGAKQKKAPSLVSEGVER